jgi:hypothetical protein
MDLTPINLKMKNERSINSDFFHLQRLSGNEPEELIRSSNFTD